MSSSTRTLFMLCALQIFVWGVFAPSFHTALPLDLAELVAFSGEGVIANYKHPNLPGLLFELAAWITGAFDSVYIVSQLSVIAAYVAIYLLGVEFLGERKALVSVMLTGTIFYYHWPTPEFNHNILQIPLWAWATLLSWRAVNNSRLIYWFALGVVAGAMVWSKYSSGILLLWIFIWLMAYRNGRERFKSAGPYLCGLVFLLIAAPQLLYLLESEFLPFEYAARRASEGGISDSIKFFLTQFANHMFFILVLLVGGLVGRGMLAAKSNRRSDVSKFLLLVVVMPLLMVTILPIVSGKGLKSMWGTPMFNFSALVLLYFAGNRMTEQRARRISVLVLGLVPLIGSLYVAQHIWRSEFSEKPMRTLWPQAEMAKFFEQEYLRQAGSPLRLIAGSDWLSGTLAAGMTDKPRVSIDGDPIKSPWISAELAQGAGALIIWQGEPVASLMKFAGHLGVDLQQSRQAEFVWHSDKADKPIVIQYIIVPPTKP